MRAGLELLGEEGWEGSAMAATFRTVAEIAGDSVGRLPDGETGPRTRFTLRDGVDPACVDFDLGFDTTAAAAYPERTWGGVRARSESRAGEQALAVLCP